MEVLKEEVRLLERKLELLREISMLENKGFTPIPYMIPVTPYIIPHYPTWTDPSTLNPGWYSSSSGTGKYPQDCGVTYTGESNG